MSKFEYPPTPRSPSTSSDLPVIDSPPSSSSTDDVAIVGMSCRTAGGNNTPEKLWKFLLGKKHASGEVPAKRWEPWLRRDPRNAKVIKNTNTKGYFINDLENFDAAFFGISPKEAELMDPHQRLALELSWEALENAGIDPKKLARSDTAVFMGVDSDDYSRLIMEDLPNVEAWSGIGTAYHGIPNRISYHLGLMGPSTAIDAACASSLVAIHLARQAIVSGESTVALCGGVNALCAPGLTRMLDKAGALSSNGLCQSFDDDAHGYARGEGGAIIVLKRLASAIADDDNILAVLKGSASAQDGKTNGIMAPNGKAQELVAREALRRAGDMDPLTIGYVEAHATSTSLGDPTEVAAIANVYGVGRPSSALCAIGSIKPNIGHLEAAAGAIGFVKAVLAVNKGELAPQTLLKKLNTRIDWENTGLNVVREHSKWPETLTLRRAAICSYGYGGSVSHVIIEQTPPSYATAQAFKKGDADKKGESIFSLVISSFQEKRLANQAISLADWLVAEGSHESLEAIASTLAQRRAAQDYRIAFTVATHDEATEVMRNFANGSLGKWATSNRILGSNVRKDVVWVFSGHGAQWTNMGKHLLEDPIFYEAIASLEHVIEEEAEFSALSALKHGDIGEADRIQVLTYLVQVGLTAVLKSKGIEPQAIIGHSVGEIAASVAAGCLTPEAGALVVSRRAKLYAQVKGQGGMALVLMSFSQVAAELGSRRDIVAAIDSSPSSCVVSGEVAALEQYIATLHGRGVRTFRVKANIPFHSPMLDRLVDPLKCVLSGVLNPRPAAIPIYSTSALHPRAESLRSANYWVRNMVDPVRLKDAVEAAAIDGYRIFLEVSTHPIVTHSIAETLATQGFEDSATIGVMERNVSANRSVLHAVSHLHTLGAAVDFKTQFGTGHWATSVPGMPWVQKPYWKEVETGCTISAQQHDVDKHTLLGQCIDIAGTDTRIYLTMLDDKSKPYPLIHPLDGIEIIPAAVYCNTFRRATGATSLDELGFRVPTTLTADQREVQVVVQDNTVRLSSRLKSPVSPDEPQQPWVEHSACKWNKQDMSALQQAFDIEDIKKRIRSVLPNSFALDFLQAIGVSGIAFPWAVLEHYGNPKEMIVKMDMAPNSQSLSWDSQSWAPFFDAATSVGSSIFFTEPKMRIVSGIDHVQFVSDRAPPKLGYLHIQDATDKKSLAADISVLDLEGELLVKLQCMRFSDVETVSDRTTGIDALVHRLAWIAPAFGEEPLSLDNVFLVTEDTELAKTYASELRPFTRTLEQVSSVNAFDEATVLNAVARQPAVVIYIPSRVQTSNEISEKAHAYTWEAASILNILAAHDIPARLFIITDSVYKGLSPTALAQAPLHGFARIAAQEHPELWGALIDNEGPHFPLLATRYVQGQDVIRIRDGLPRVARLRPFITDQRHDVMSGKTLLPKAHGTYVVTGGFGGIGLEILDFLVAKGARRIVVISRRGLPPRNDWPHATGQMKSVVNKIRELETKGATVHGIALNIGAPDAHIQIHAALDRLALAPVLGVIHAAGVKEDALIRDTTPESFARVFSPKLAGTLALHKAFPPTTLDFFILFSSIGQLVGTPGQAPYGGANAFLDTFATHRRQQGDNAVAFQWTAWRDTGLVAGDPKFLIVELSSKGITDITCEEGFQAWEHLSKYDTDHAVITRARVLDADEPIPFPLVTEIATRRPPTISPQSLLSSSNPISTKSTSGPELRDYLTTQIKQCLSTVLHLDIEEIDTRAVVADLGVDSVMMGALRWEMQKVLGLKVPPTLVWKVRTVAGLVEWAFGKTGEAGEGKGIVDRG